MYLPLIIFFFLPFTKFLKEIAIEIAIVTITVIAIETLVEIAKVTKILIFIGGV